MAQKKLHSFAFSSPLDSKTLTKTVTKPDGSVVALYAFPVLPASPFRTMDSRSNIEFSYVGQQLIDDYNEQGRRHPLDIEHNTERGGDTRARGWSVEMTTAEHEPDIGFEPGVLYCWYELTSLGLQEHNDQLYGYTSAVADGFWLDENNVQFNHIKSNARTNNPATKVPFSLTAVNEADAPGSPAYTPENASFGDDPAMLKAILEALGLTAETDEAAALAAVTSLKDQAAQADLAARIDASDVTEGFTGSFVANTRVEAVQTQLTDLTTQLTAARGEVDALTTKLTTAETTVTELRASQTEAQLTAMVDGFVLTKQLTPGMRDEALDLARTNPNKFQAFVAKFSAVHNADEQRAPAAGLAHLNLTAEQLAMCKAHNIDPAIYAKNLQNL